jgi:hypothetical protein
VLQILTHYHNQWSPSRIQWKRLSMMIPSKYSIVNERSERSIGLKCTNCTCFPTPSFSKHQQKSVHNVWLLSQTRFVFLLLYNKFYLNNTYIAIQKQPAPTKGDTRSPIRLSFQQNPPKPKIGSGRITLSEMNAKKSSKTSNSKTQ